MSKDLSLLNIIRRVTLIEGSSIDLIPSLIEAGELQSWSLDENHQFPAETIKLIKLANLS